MADSGSGSGTPPPPTASQVASASAGKKRRNKELISTETKSLKIGIKRARKNPSKSAAASATAEKSEGDIAPVSVLSVDSVPDAVGLLTLWGKLQLLSADEQIAMKSLVLDGKEDSMLDLPEDSRILEIFGELRASYSLERIREALESTSEIIVHTLVGYGEQRQRQADMQQLRQLKEHQQPQQMAPRDKAGSRAYLYTSTSVAANQLAVVPKLSSTNVLAVANSSPKQGPGRKKKADKKPMYPKWCIKCCLIPTNIVAQSNALLAPGRKPFATNAFHTFTSPQCPFFFAKPARLRDFLVEHVRNQHSATMADHIGTLSVKNLAVTTPNANLLVEAKRIVDEIYPWDDAARNSKERGKEGLRAEDFYRAFIAANIQEAKGNYGEFPQGWSMKAYQ